ncbi:MAG: UbiH/UbiF/VisC/COQ6 family ubiquinone biosynthesis hydroxylase [Gammaproteobacteria bacterium]|nr:UbiH/UbiF/VisC/COQ6 family ubiquinone biosynthesis hydroxylase [Gammaproteobacteria bacterium]
MSAPAAIQRDVIVIGGGMVGAAFAAAAAREGLSVALVDAATPKPYVQGAEYDLRVSALSRASQAMFERLGAWPLIEAQRLGPFRDMHVWDAGGEGAVHFSAADLGEPALGHIVENSLVQSSLWQVLERDSERVSIFSPDAVTSIEKGSSSVAVSLKSGTMLQAKLLVAADGAGSATREQFGIGVSGAAYQQRGLVAVVRGEKGHGEVARQRFLPGGPLALLPLDDEHAVSIVWSLPESDAERLLALDDAAFLAELTAASDGVLGQLQSVSKRAAFPLRRQHAERYVDPRLALIGDAAHVVHPLAGQGANLGFLDAASLAEVLGEARRAGKDIGSLRVLRRYERWRKGDNLATLWTMDGFKKLFSNDDTMLAKLRNTGFALFDRATPLKHAAIRKAMGLSGDLPKLAK